MLNFCFFFYSLRLKSQVWTVGVRAKLFRWDDLQTEQWAVQWMPFTYIGLFFDTCVSLGKVFAESASSFKTPSCSSFIVILTLPPGSCPLQSHGFTEGYVVAVEGESGCSFILFLVDFYPRVSLRPTIATYTCHLSFWTLINNNATFFSWRDSSFLLEIFLVRGYKIRMQHPRTI